MVSTSRNEVAWQSGKRASTWHIAEWRKAATAGGQESLATDSKNRRSLDHHQLVDDPITPIARTIGESLDHAWRQFGSVN